MRPAATPPASRATQLLVLVFAASSAFGARPAIVALAVLTLAVVFDLARHRASPRDVPRDAGLYVALFGWQAMTRAIATSLRDVLTLHDAAYRLPYVVVGVVRSDEHHLRRALHVLFGAHSAVVIAALVQRALDREDVGPALFHEAGDRLSGFTGHPNSASGVLAIVALLAVAVGLHTDRRCLVYAPVLLAGLVFAGGRGYLAGVALGVVMIGATAPRARRTAVPFLVGLAVLAACVAIAPGLRARVATAAGSDAFATRTAFWSISWQTFLDHPVVGVGSERLPRVLAPHVAAGEIDNDAQGHSLYLHQLAENGVLGLVLVVGTYGWFLVKHLRRYARTRRSDPAALAPPMDLAIGLAIVALFIDGIGGNNVGDGQVALQLALAMGLVHATAKAASTLERGAAIRTEL